MEALLNIEVELDIFSGRVNPRWPLGHDELRLLRAVPDQPSVTGETPSPPGLGYRGLVITNLGTDDSIPRRLRVYAGTVIVDERGNAVRQPDELEEVLLSRARDLGYGELIERSRGPGGTAAGPSDAST